MGSVVWLLDFCDVSTYLQKYVLCVFVNDVTQKCLLGHQERWAVLGWSHSRNQTDGALAKELDLLAGNKRENWSQPREVKTCRGRWGQPREVRIPSVVLRTGFLSAKTQEG